MTVFNIKILIAIFICIQCKGYAQSEKPLMVIPLKTGKNPSTSFEDLTLEPAHLFIQSNPIDHNAPHIQLQLNIVKNHSKYATFLWYYNAPGIQKKTNYPIAFLNYAFYLKVDKKSVELVVEALDFEKTMYMNLGQTAIIGDLKIRYTACVSESVVAINGHQEAAFNTYSMSLSNGHSQETISFNSMDKQTKKQPWMAWKNYKIYILEDSEKALKLKVSKTDL